MESWELADAFGRVLENKTASHFENKKVYYFALGQMLMHVLQLLGGADQNRRIMNYLTNPAIPVSIQVTGSRVKRFLLKVPHKIVLDDRCKRILSLLSCEAAESNVGKADLQTYEEAFFSGIYYDSCIYFKISSDIRGDSKYL